MVSDPDPENPSAARAIETLIVSVTETAVETETGIATETTTDVAATGATEAQPGAARARQT
jgi:hypothetical protein